METGGPAIARRIDHVNVVVPDPRAFLRVLTEQFELPVAWPFMRFPSFASGAAAIGINVEPVRYAPGHPSPAGDYAGLYAIAFEPEPLDQARGELSRRGIPHSPPLSFTGRYPAEANTSILHRPAHEDGALWTLIVLGGLIGDESSARRYSRGLERGAGRFAPILGRIAGRIGSGRFAARLSAQGTSKRPFVFLCKYHGFNIPEGHAVGLADLASRAGGPLGLVRTQELVVTARDAAAEVDRWQGLLAPLEPTEPGRWQPGDGPAVRIAEGPEDRIDRMVWTVRSRDRAADWLRGQGMLGKESEETISIAPDALQGVNVALAAEDA